MKNNKEIKQSKRIVGYDILKVIMAFEIVCCHFGQNIADNNFISKKILDLKLYAVPVFMYLSFYLIGKNLSDLSLDFIKKRFSRIVIPYIFWGVVGSILCWIGNTVFSDYRFVEKLDLNAVIWQLMTGHSKINPSLWYSMVLLWIMIVLIIIELVFGKCSKYLLGLITILCIISQYTGFNYNMFSQLPYELMYPLGRFYEMFPYATIGIWMANLNINDRIRESKKTEIGYVLFLIGAFIFVCSFRVNIGNITPNYMYGGLKYLFAAMILVSFAELISFHTEHNNKLDFIISKITSYTMGIYYMHFVVGKYIEVIFINLSRNTQTVFMCIVIYLICYMISALINVIFSFGKYLVS